MEELEVMEEVIAKIAGGEGDRELVRRGGGSGGGDIEDSGKWRWGSGGVSSREWRRCW